MLAKFKTLCMWVVIGFGGLMILGEMRMPSEGGGSSYHRSGYSSSRSSGGGDLLETLKGKFKFEPSDRR